MSSDDDEKVLRVMAVMVKAMRDEGMATLDIVPVAMTIAGIAASASGMRPAVFVDMVEKVVAATTRMHVEFPS